MRPANSPGVPARPRPTLRWLFIASLLPGLLAVVLLGHRYFQQERAQIQEDLLQTARALTQAVDRELASSEVILQTLATAQSLAVGDLAGFHRRAAMVLANCPADNIVLTDPEGQQLVNLKRPFGEALPKLGDLELVRRVVATGRPAVSGLFRGSVMQRLVVGYGVPVYRNGKVAYVLVMARFPERFGKILSDQKFPAGWIGVVFDQGNTIVARTHGPERFVGQPAAPGIARALAGDSEGLMRAATIEGIPGVGAYSRSALSGWAVAVLIPAGQLDAMLWRSFAPLALAMLVLTGSGLGLAWYFGSYITRALRQLGAAVHGAMGGQLTEPLPTTGPKEITRLADDFNGMLKARQEAESALRESEHFYHSLFDHMLNGFAYGRVLFEGDEARDFIFLSVNPAFEKLTGLRNVAGDRASDAMPGIRENDPGMLAACGRVARSGVPERSEIYVKTLGQWFAIAIYSPQAGHFVAVFDVITERKEQQAKIDRLVRIYAVLSGINSIIVRNHDRQTLLDAVCQVAVEAGRFGMAWIGLLNADGQTLHPVAGCGIDRHALPDIPISEGAEVPSGQGTAYEALTSKRAVYCNDIAIVPRVGPVRAQAIKYGYRSVCALPLVVDGKGIGIIGLYAREAGFFDEEEMKLLDELAADISFALQYIEREDRLRYQAYYDGLTGLPNRTLFEDRLTQLIHQARDSGRTVSTLLLDLDNFTHVNETFGRHAGDALLKQVAERLLSALHEPFTLARIGADNFAIAVGNLEQGAEAAAIVQERICHALERSFLLEGRPIHVTAHLGISLYPGDGEEAETLFQSAEAALKEAQATGLRCLYYAPEINARIAADLILETELRTALEARQLVMHFQPRVDLRSGKIVGAEALIRWQHPERGLIPPAEFIPLAERTGLIVPIGAWVIDTVCAQQAAWLAEGLDIVPVAVNLSPIQFTHDNLVATLEGALTGHGLDVKYLELELTESLVMRSPEEAARTMNGIRRCGLRLSLDDFGTGYSSLAYLHRFPFDFVKIDRAFVSDITENPSNAAIATAVIAMAHRLKLRVVAEGVETEGQMRYLRQHDCDQIQGFYFSPAVPADAFAAMLRGAKRLSFGEAQPDGAERTVLIVDDEPNILAALNRVLRREGYRVLKASSGKEGLELLALHKAEVIISDQRMPNMSGSEFLSIVKELYPDTIRIVLSGYTDLQVVTDAVNRGAVYKFLTKPWEDDLLKENVRDAFLRYSGAASQRRRHAPETAEAAGPVASTPDGAAAIRNDSDPETAVSIN